MSERGARVPAPADLPRAPGWESHGERSLYESEWVNLRLADVEVPSGRRFEHHVVRFDRPAAGTVVRDPDRGVLLLWRHRFITGSWGWEIPGGGVDPGETEAEAAAREVLEETGWRPGPVRRLASYHPSNGVSDQTFSVYLADGATHEGPPSDPDESTLVAWVPVPEVREALLAGQVRDGLSLTALLWVLALGDEAAAPAP